MKKSFIFAGVVTLLATTAVATGLFVNLANHKTMEKASADGETVVKYLPMNSTNFYTGEVGGDRFDNKSIEELTSPRFDTFHEGRRVFNALDNFLNTITIASGEGRKGAVRSIKWVHRGGYVSFLMGGNNDNFVNIFKETEPKGDIIDHVRSGFYSSRGDAWDDAYRNGENAAFELSANMSLKYYYIPDEYIGQEFIVYIEDNTTGYYGGVTFGDFRINQTLEEVARTFSAHKQQLALDAQLSTQNAWGSNYILNTLYETDYYAPLRTAEAALNNADEGFETYGLTNWAYDRQFSSAAINFVSTISSDDAKGGFAERMPANKSDNLYFNSDASGIDEGEKYKLISSEFTLGGTGFISAKLGGGTAVVSLIDNTGAELVTTRINTAEGTNILNPNFYDPAGGVSNIMTSGARLNTMTRTYLDASAHLGKKVRVVLSDERTGGNWGLAYFDEIVTKYDSLPTLKVDAIQQQYGENPLYHGVVTDKFYGSNDTTFKQAYDFVQRYYGVMRDTSKGKSWCTISDNDDVKDLLDDYDALNSDVKALVTAAQDYDFGSAATSENWYLATPNLEYTIGQTVAYINGGGGVSIPSRVLGGYFNTATVGTEIALVSAVVIVAFALFLFLRQKRKVRKQK